MKLRFINILLFLLLLLLLFYPPSATAYDGIFSILDETGYNGSLEIVTDYPEPDKTVQSQKHIRGWIDIIGFNETVRINGIEYCNQSEPIVKYDVWDEGLFWNNNFDWIKIEDERVTTTGTTTTAEVDIHLMWHSSTLKSRTVCNPVSGCRTISWVSKTYFHEYYTLATTAEVPPKIPKTERIVTSINIFNNSINPHIEINVPVINTSTKTVYSYDNETITRYNLAGIATEGSVNLSSCQYWEDESDIFAYKNNNAILKNIKSSQFNPNNLTITVHNPYETQQITDFNLTITEFGQKPKTSPEGVSIIIPLLILLIFGLGIKKCTKIWSELI